MERKDVHAPSVIIPEDYEYVAQEVFPTAEMMSALGCGIVQHHRELIRKHMARTGGNYSGHEHGGNCGVCGSVNAIYTVLFYHAKTNTYVRMGQDCAAKCDMGADNAFKAFKEGIKSALEMKAGKTKAKALLEQKSLSECWPIYEKFHEQLAKEQEEARQFGPVKSAIPYEEKVIADMIGKLIKYGSLSESQWAYLAKLPSKIGERAAKEAERAAEDARALPPPEGRAAVVVTVLTTRVDEGPFGTTCKMLVKHKDGWRAWGTLPSGMTMEDKGRTVRIKATFSASDKDPKFGFFKRPMFLDYVQEVAG